ncbi:hypothetical protein JCM8547_006713 [Rhodosporidiobolus lusitaniae]
MNRPTLSTLPEDVLEEIFGQLEAILVYKDKRVKGFLPLTSICRDLVPVACRFFNADPAADFEPIGNQAVKLLTALDPDQGALGRLVRSLDSLAYRMYSLDELPSPSNLSFQVRGQSKAYSWLFAILQACPNLHSVGVTFRSTTQLSKVVASLFPSFPTLKSVKVCSVYREAIRLDKRQDAEFDSFFIPPKDLCTTRGVSLQTAITFRPVDSSTLRTINPTCKPWTSDTFLTLSRASEH